MQEWGKEKRPDNSRQGKLKGNRCSIHSSSGDPIPLRLMGTVGLGRIRDPCKQTDWRVAHKGINIPQGFP